MNVVRIRDILLNSSTDEKIFALIALSSTHISEMFVNTLIESKDNEAFDYLRNNYLFDKELAFKHALKKNNRHVIKVLYDKSMLNNPIIFNILKESPSLHNLVLLGQ